MKITYYGHSCFSAQIANRLLLFDPFISHNELAGHVDVQKVQADYILISHGHADHVGDAEAIAKRTGALVISNFEITVWLGNRSVQRTCALNHGGTAVFDFGRAKFVNAIHSSSLPDGAYGGNPGGFVIQSGEGNFYYAGDTALTFDMKLIGESTRLAFAALPIGGTFTMDVDDAVRASDFLACREILGLHYNTFSPIRIDEQEALRKFEATGKRLHLPKPGETINL